MSFNGSGTFVINSSGQPVVANTVISSTVFNALTADLATGLSTCITKDGQTTPTANIPMGTFKFTNLGNGSAATDSATLGQVQASTTKLVTVTGTDTIAGTMNPALTAYASGQMFYFIAAGANTGAVTLNIDGLGARNVTRDGSTALAANDILSGEVALVVYDGTRFQLLNPANAGSMTVSNLTVTGTTTLSGLTASTALALDASKNVVSVTNTGTGNNVLATSPTLVTPTLGAASATSVAAGLGAVGTPSYTFTGDLNTGLWSPAADTLAASTGGSERMRITSSGLVGIGTVSPSFNFQVSGAQSVGFSVSGTYSGPSILSSGSNTLYFQPNGTLSVFGGNGVSFPATLSIRQASGSAAFSVEDSAAANSWFFINSSGNVGIGTASPAARLQVKTQTNANAAFQNSTSVAGGVKINCFNDAGSASSPFELDGSTLQFNIASVERMRLDASGNLGIGTASPTTKVEVYGGASGTATNLTVGNANTAFLFGVDAGNNCQIRTAQNVPMIFYTNATNRGGVDGAGNWTLGGGTLATSATDGFLYVPTCAGTPTGTPTTKTGFAPIVINTTNNKLYFYSGGQWRDAGP